MKLHPGHEYPGFALRFPSGEIPLALICDTEREAMELQKQHAIHHRHMARPKVVMVEVTVKVVD